MPAYSHVARLYRCIFTSLAAFLFVALPAASFAQQKPAEPEFFKVLQRQQDALPAFRASWTHAVTFHGSEEEAKKYREKTTAEIAELRSGYEKNVAEAEKLKADGNPLRSNQQTEFARNKKDRADLLENTLESTVTHLSKSKTNKSTIDITYLNPKSYIITQNIILTRSADSKSTKPLPSFVNTWYCNEGKIYCVKEISTSKSIDIMPYTDLILSEMGLGIPSLGMNHRWKEEASDFIFQTTQTPQGAVHKGTHPMPAQETLTDDEKEVFAKYGQDALPVYVATFNAQDQLVEIKCESKVAGADARTWSDYTTVDGVALPKAARYDYQRKTFTGKADHFSTEMTLTNFHKLDEAEASRISTAWVPKPGYRINDLTGPTPLETTSDELMKKSETGAADAKQQPAETAK